MQNTHKDSQHPMAVWCFFFLAVIGIGQTLSQAKPGSIQESLSPLMQTVWSAMLGFGALLAFVGIVWKWSVRWALEMESIGQLMVAGGAITYSIAIFAVARLDGMLPTALCLTLAAACLLRRRKIESVLTAQARRHKKRIRLWRRQQK